MKIRRKNASETICTETLIIEGHSSIHLDVMELKCGVVSTHHDMIEGKALHRSDCRYDGGIRLYWTI